MKRSEMVDLIVSMKNILPDLKISRAEASVVLSNMEKAGILAPHKGTKTPDNYIDAHKWEPEDYE